MAKIRVAFMVAFVATALMAVGLGGTTAGAAAKPKSGGQFTYIVNLDFRNLDPINVNGYTSFGGAVIPALYGGLFYVDRETLKPVPWFAESGTTSDDGTTWTIKIRPNIKFS